MYEAPPPVDEAYLADRYGGDYGKPRPRPWVGSRLRKWIGSKVRRRRRVSQDDDIGEQEAEWTRQWEREDAEKRASQ